MTGLGKTYVSSEKALSFKENVVLVVCQKSKVQDWVDHFRTHYSYIPDFTYDLTDKKQFQGFLDHCEAATNPTTENCYGVINYDLLFRKPKFLKMTDYTLILDESSVIKNTKTKRAKFVLKMTPTNVIMLSGTICGGKYENLYTQLHLLGWEISEKVYNAQYVNWKKINIGGMIHKIVNKDDPYRNVERLKQKMREHGSVFMKTDEVFDLPEQNFIRIKIPTTKEYRKFKRDRLITIDGTEFVGDSILSYRLYQRQLCTAFNPNKLQAFRDLLDSTQDRLIVFYQFTCELVELQAICNDFERPYSIVNGSYKDLTAYEKESNSVALVQYQAGAMGLNLQKANKIVYFSLTEEAELFEQSKKRIHRIGQNQPCFYYLLICENSIEDQEILPTLNVRKEYNDDLFEEVN